MRFKYLVQVYPSTEKNVCNVHAEEGEFEGHYHLRSNVEITFSALKMKFGDSLKSKNLAAQKNELFCKVIDYNITVLIHEMFELEKNLTSIKYLYQSFHDLQ